MFSSQGSATSFLSSELSSGSTNTGIKVEMLRSNFNASVEELERWVNHMESSNSRVILHHLSQLTIQTNASRRDAEHSARECQCGTMEQTGVTHAHKHFAIEGWAFLLTFTKMFQNKSIHVQIDVMVALTFVVKMGGITKQQLTNLAKEIWSFLL